jgi:phospholipid/cholesterol/gamma-HCH transport system substrate-binding protein
MEADARYKLVGTSVLVLVLMVAAAIVWLVATGQRRDVQSYKIYFARQSLEGLQVRSDVRMKGIRIGAVTGFSFSASRPGTVEVVVGVNPSTPVRESTRAVVDRNLITGLASVRLLNLKEDSPLLQDPEDGSNDRVIAEGESQLQVLSDTVSELAQRTDETMRRINGTLSDANQAALSETLVNLRNLSKSTVGVVERLDGTLVALNGTVRALKITTEATGQDVHRLAERYDDLGSQAKASVRDVTASVRDVTGTVKQLGSDISLITGRTDVLLTNIDLEIARSTQQLRAAAEALGTTARRFNDPRAALFGPSDGSLGPGEARR